jgi:hypothetical protein
MNQHLFRSTDEWKAALLTLPDNTYFDLMRSVFGNIKTPFNKHRLMEDLVSFLTRRETQEIIAAYIDETDRRIFAAIAILGEPVPGDLESFFSDEYSYLEIHGMLLNLEERFIVYRFQEGGIYHLALNPILEAVLTPCIMDRSALLPSFPFPPIGSGDDSPLDDRMIAALFAFVLEEGEIFKAEGGFRKKASDDGKRIFPSLNVEPLIGGLYSIGLFFSNGNQLLPDAWRLTVFRDLSSRERREYLAGGIYSYYQDPETIKRYSNRSRIQKLAHFAHRFISALEDGRAYPRTTLKRLLEIIERDDAGNFRWAEAGTIPMTIGAAGIGSFLEALEAVDLIKAGSGGTDSWRLIPVPDSGSGQRQPASGAAAVIAMDTPFSCILYPEISFADALTLASFCSVRETGVTVRFELTRKSVVRGFDLSLDAAAMIGHLERLSGKSVDQNLRWTLEDWENRYSGVALHQGTVLVLSEERRYLARTEPIASLIARTLGPGVYLLSSTGEINQETDEVVQGLQKAGVDIIARPPLPDRNKTASIAEKSAPIRGPSPYPPLRAPPLFSVPACDVPLSYRVMEAEFKDAASYQERFHRALREQSLPRAEANELAARIDRRLILNVSQLAGGTVRGEKMEARNLDYVGKTMVAKQAIALKSPVEVLCVTPEGETSRLMGIPGALEKWGSETILSLKTIPEGNDIRLSLGKISLLRRIKQSIFGG